MKIKALGIVTFAALASGGCATSFTGSAHVEGGRGACETKCRGQGMELAGMVYLGEYSSGCVCGTPGQTAMARSQLLASAASGAGAAGVALQTRRAQQSSQHHH